MSNMSYCRFQNTLSDFRECADWLEDAFVGEKDSPLSMDELQAASELLERAARLLARAAEAHGDGGTNAFALPDGTELEDYDWRSVAHDYCL